MDEEWLKKKINIEDVEKDDFMPTKEFLTKKISIEDAKGDY